jgi:asparagine synthase (glutamine-hydrolysing)
MCGICGKVTSAKEERKTSIENVEWMMDRLKHRGPDDSGIWSDSLATLGHRRLSIIDLSAEGRQPMISEDGKKSIVFNGEIYNFQEIKKRFQNEISFRFQNDTEVIIKLYEKFGSECLNYFRGMFAFAIWDSSRQELFFARDRLGKKPFFYRIKNGGITFASELHALLGHASGSEFEVDEESLSHYLTLQYVPSPKTIFRDIWKLPPAHFGIFKKGEVRIQQYWSLPHQTKKWNEADALERFHDLFRESVRLRMIADVPIGTFLSGGLDSSAVVAMMRELVSEPIQTFTVRFEEKEFDESPYAREVGKIFQTKHQELTVTPDLIGILPELVRHYSEPYADASAIPFFYLSKTTRQHVKVALSGDGGDELFGGYSRYMFKEPNGHLPSALQGAIRHLPVNVRYIWRLRKILEERGFDLPSIYLQKICVFNEQEKEKLMRPEFYEKVKEKNTLSWYEEIFKQFEGVSFPEKLMAADIITYLPDDLLVKADIASMACSLEVRSPFLDHELMEFAASLPGDFKIRNGTSKYLLKRYLGKKLPDGLIHRTKTGFGLPTRMWFRTSLRPFLEEVLLSKSSFSRDYFRDGVVEKLIRNHASGWVDNTYKLYALLVLELWHHEFAGSK